MTIEMQSPGLIPRLLNQELSSRVGGGGLVTDRWFLCTRVWEERSWEKSILDGEFHKITQLCNPWPLAQDLAHTRNSMHFLACLLDWELQSSGAQIEITKR